MRHDPTDGHHDEAPGRARLLRHFRLAALAEAATLALLVGVGVPLEHLAHRPVLVWAMGPVHGLAFVNYAMLLLETIEAGLWSRRELWRLVLAAFVPFAGFFSLRLVDRRLSARRGYAAPARAPI